MNGRSSLVWMKMIWNWHAETVLPCCVNRYERLRREMGRGGVPGLGGVTGVLLVSLSHITRKNKTIAFCRDGVDARMTPLLGSIARGKKQAPEVQV